MQRAVVGDVAEIAAPLAAFGNPAVVAFYLHGDSTATDGSAVDLYPDVADQATSADDSARMFSYSTASNQSGLR